MLMVIVGLPFVHPQTAYRTRLYPDKAEFAAKGSELLQITGIDLTLLALVDRYATDVHPVVETCT
jgi:hypothetical protein